MPSEGTELVHCYNRGCGQKYDPKENKEDSCTFHPGAPFFHDAYKGWSCCNRKCTDFTEFLNIKGCTKSFHSNVKPPEPEKPKVDKSKADEIIEYKTPQPVIHQALERPPFDSPLVDLKPEISPALEQQVTSLTKLTASAEDPVVAGEIAIGTSCKNGGCKQTYEGPQSNSATCRHHPGYPVFHEGLKFWSCCQRRTTDFNSFLEQEGCELGKHVWHKEKGDSRLTKCRYDWHQTPSTVVVSIFAKKYDPKRSSVQVNPIRLKINLHLPEEGSVFSLDLELRGVVDVQRCGAHMYPTKLEVKLQKAEPGSWSKLDFPRALPQSEEEEQEPHTQKVEELVPEVDAVDLSDL